MPRFVVLRHQTPPGYPRPTHFDLMLEQGEALRTWACPSLPAIGQEMVAEELPAHRLDYLDYEGEVSAGRGQVTRVAAGEYEMLEETTDAVRVRLDSEQLASELLLARLPGQPRFWRITLTG